MTQPDTITSPCLQCGLDFSVLAHYARFMAKRERPQRFCSTACWQAFRRTLPKPDSRPCGRCGNILAFTLENFPPRERCQFGLETICRLCRNVKALPVNKAAIRAIKIQVITAYGNGVAACVCCSESHVEFLTLDHIAGGGVLDRRQSGGVTGLYRRLRRENFPGGYRTLCFNCNCSLGMFGYCPHGKLTKVRTVS